MSRRRQTRTTTPKPALTEQDRRAIRASAQHQDEGLALGKTWGNSILPPTYNTTTTKDTNHK